jgi:cytidylate kinase
MAVITISRGSYSKGKEVAEKVAERLGYGCLSRDIILEASEEFHVPEIKLIRAIHDSPSILDGLSFGKERYVAYIRSALLQHFRKDNTVYHGLAGHFFVKGISHALKVRIIADMEDRIRLEMEREGITRAEAVHILKKDDEERRKWSQALYGIDTWDPALYDLVIHIHKITVDDAVDIICHTAGLQNFQTTPESLKAMDDLALAAEVKTALMQVHRDVEVTADDGVIYAKVVAPISKGPTLSLDLQKAAKGISGVKETKIDVLPLTPFSE